LPPPFPQLPTSPAEASGFLPGSPATSPADASTYPPGAALPWVAGQRPSAPAGQPGTGQPAPNQPAESPGLARQSESAGGDSAQGRSPGGLLGRPFAQGPADDPLPPPPWARSDSATLAPLPAAAADPAGRGRLVAAIIAAVIAAVIGFFGVRIIADLATDDAAPASSSVSTSQG
jgi:hypothetical protein